MKTKKKTWSENSSRGKATAEQKLISGAKIKSKRAGLKASQPGV